MFYKGHFCQNCLPTIWNNIEGKRACARHKTRIAKVDGVGQTLGNFKGKHMNYLHTMVRVADLDASLDFYVTKMGMVETNRREFESGRFTLVFLAADEDVTTAKADRAPELELTYNWDGDEAYTGGRNFGHLAYTVENVYEFCQKLMDAGVTINRPPREGRMAFVKSPDGISFEILQQGDALPVAEPWASMENTGDW